MDDQPRKHDGSGRPAGVSPGRTTISGQRARQGRIVLNTRTRRAIFIGGLAGIVVLILVFGVLV